MTRRARNVLFVMCDQLRADYLSCYGNHTVSTPNIDRLADRGTRYTRAASYGYSGADEPEPAARMIASGGAPSVSIIKRTRRFDTGSSGKSLRFTNRLAP
jgi:hypothetical protein